MEKSHGGRWGGVMVAGGKSRKLRDHRENRESELEVGEATKFKAIH